MERRKVLFPQPDGPIMATTSPCLHRGGNAFQYLVVAEAFTKSFYLDYFVHFIHCLLSFALSQSLLQLSHACIQSENEDEIEAGYYAQWHHCLVGDASDDVGTLGQVYQSDITADRGFLEQSDELDYPLPEAHS